MRTMLGDTFARTIATVILVVADLDSDQGTDPVRIRSGDMAEDGMLAKMRHWIAEHKLRAVGTLWATSVIGSFAYNFANPNMKTSVKIIHARLHAQALTLAALVGAGLVDYYDHQTGEKAKRYEKHIEHA
ncbi:hypothetical protein R1sor_009439 [Riccia sorocarpa]|uniref:HIG1 domain-containing protein n=1 Tax=Riccia sorocarpa TaxID=122646 RepID=A0ABD3HVD1_9MARC